jgi:N-methylhydantoinase B
MKYPLLVHEQRIVPDSEGAGRFRGSPSAHVEYGPIAGCAMEVVYLSDGTVNPSAGVRGGHDGATATQRKRARDGTLSDELGSYAHVVLEPGETIVGRTSSGGGYGPPEERDERRVEKDVREGLVTLEKARDVYRVAIGDDGRVDEAATRRLRGA